MPTVRYSLVTIGVGDKFLQLGTVEQEPILYEIYDTLTDSWSMIANMPHAGDVWRRQ